MKLALGLVLCLVWSGFAAAAEDPSADESVTRVADQLEKVAADLEQLQTFTRKPSSGDLVLAATEGNTVGARLLLDRGADPNQRDSYGSSATEAAVLRGHEDLLQLLLARGADPNARGLLGVTPLMLAAERGDADAVRILLENGADPAAVSETGRTAWRVAERGRQIAVMDLLRQTGMAEPMPTHPTVGGTRIPKRSELSEIISSGDPDSDLLDAAVMGDTVRVNQLLRKGANVEAKEALGMTALMHAAQNGHGEVMNELLLAGAKVNARSSMGYTALACAAMEGRDAAIHMLILWGADVRSTGFAGTTPLMLAAQNGHAESARVLISWGADLNQGNAFGMTPLMFAARKGHLKTVNLLLKMGAEVGAREKIAGQTAWVIALKENQHIAAECIRQAGGTD